MVLVPIPHKNSMHHQASSRAVRRSGRSARRAGPMGARLGNLKTYLAPGCPKQSMIVHDTTPDQAPLRLYEFRTTLNAAGCGHKIDFYSVKVKILLLLSVANVSNNQTNPSEETSSSIAIGLSVHCFASLQSFFVLLLSHDPPFSLSYEAICVAMFARCAWCT